MLPGCELKRWSCRKNLDVDISYFFTRPSTLDNVCLFVWRNLEVVMRPHPYHVAEVKVKVSGCRRGAGNHGLLSSEVTYRGTLCLTSLYGRELTQNFAGETADLGS